MSDDHNHPFLVGIVVGSIIASVILCMVFLLPWSQWQSQQEQQQNEYNQKQLYKQRLDWNNSLICAGNATSIYISGYYKPTVTINGTATFAIYSDNFTPLCLNHYVEIHSLTGYDDNIIASNERAYILFIPEVDK